jgi:hypothetical protein
MVKTIYRSPHGLLGKVKPLVIASVRWRRGCSAVSSGGGTGGGLLHWRRLQLKMVQML